MYLRDGTRRWAFLSLSQTVVELQRHFEVAASEFQSRMSHGGFGGRKSGFAWNQIEFR